MANISLLVLSVALFLSGAACANGRSIAGTADGKRTDVHLAGGRRRLHQGGFLPVVPFGSNPPPAIQLRSYKGTCLTLYDASNGKQAYMWPCDTTDARQTWYLLSNGLIQSKLGTCLSIYDDSNGRNPYGWSCNAADPRQQWAEGAGNYNNVGISGYVYVNWWITFLNSHVGSTTCLSVYDGSSDATPYGWACNPNDYRQAWATVVLKQQG